MGVAFSNHHADNANQAEQASKVFRCVFCWDELRQRLSFQFALQFPLSPVVRQRHKPV